MPASPGFGKITVEPYFHAGLEFVEATHMTAAGEIRVGWKREPGGAIEVIVEVPEGADCEFVSTRGDGMKTGLKPGFNKLYL